MRPGRSAEAEADCIVVVGIQLQLVVEAASGAKAGSSFCREKTLSKLAIMSQYLTSNIRGDCIRICIKKKNFVSSDFMSACQ